MKTADFINLFKTGKLGKKRTHSEYKVMDGDNCQLLVRATRRCGVPGGSELLGVYFGDDLCLFHANFRGIRNSVLDQVSEPKPILVNTVLDENDQHIIESGVIGFDEEKRLMLVELGETPWLLEHDPSFSNHYWNWRYNTGTQVSKRVATVAEAMADIKEPDDQITRLGRLLQVMPSDYVPVSTSKADIERLMSPPTPFDYGFTLEDCQVLPMFAQRATGATPLYLKPKIAQSTLANKFNAAAIAYNEAADRFNERTPGQWEELTHNETGSILKAEGGAIFIKGHVYHRYNSSEKHDFPTWHKVLGKAKKIRLAR